MSSDPDYYPVDVDHLWLASDAQGTVAALITAARGPIAEGVFHHTGAGLGELEDELMQLPAVSEAQLLWSPRYPEAYLEPARRGIFVYDWTDVHKSPARRSYELVAIPEKPLHVDALPPSLARAAKAVRFDAISFATTPWIAMAALHPYRVPTVK